MGAAGTPACWSRASSSWVENVRVTDASISKSAPRFFTRAGLLEKRGSAGSAARSSAAQHLAKSASDPAAIITQASREGKASYGAIMGVPEPWGSGTSPDARWLVIWKVVQARAV